MNAIALKISKQLEPLPLEQRQEVLDEVREYLLDVKAYERYESYKAGEAQVSDFEATLNALEKKHGI